MNDERKALPTGASSSFCLSRTIPPEVPIWSHVQGSGGLTDDLTAAIALVAFGQPA